MCGATDGNKVYWSVGDVVLDGTTYINAMFVYNISDQTWEMRQYPVKFGVFSTYIDSSSNISIVVGDTTSDYYYGSVYTFNSGTTDNSTPIVSECELPSFVFNSRSSEKNIRELVTYAKDFQGLRLLMRVDGGEWKQVGGIDKQEKRFIVDIKGQKFTPKIVAVNSNTPFIFEGINFTKVYDEGTIQ